MATPCNSHDLRDSVANNRDLSTRFNHFFIAVREKAMKKSRDICFTVSSDEILIGDEIYDKI